MIKKFIKFYTEGYSPSEVFWNTVLLLIIMSIITALIYFFYVEIFYITCLIYLVVNILLPFYESSWDRWKEGKLMKFLVTYWLIIFTVKNFNMWLDNKFSK